MQNARVRRFGLQIASLRRLRWWELALALLPYLLAVSQLGYVASEPFHAIFGVVLGLAVGSAGFYLNLQFAHRHWRVLPEVATMIAVFISCFVAVETIALILNAMLPSGFFDR